ncbi:probable acyl-activating enzyme 17, peroxisomal [Carica papaya]|uniref:probable acyl-activating enzyme 17, peroxisomal n=1 Tax=Carica papaya TaxID=3649 RepID=UPI000B8C7FE0|nr:probable acyl-activating enzyme 17, peroxisomal [Carica papaya]
MSRETAILTNVGQLLERQGKQLLGSKYKDPLSCFSDFQEFSVANPEVYWKTVLDVLSISFSVPPQCILHENPYGEKNLSNPGGQWLPGAYMNPAKDCLSINPKRSLDDIVIRWRDEGDDHLPIKVMTLKDLRTEVWLVAHGLNALGLDTGSAIAIDMPMNVNSVVIYLAIVLAGYVVVSIADSFAPEEIATRLKISEARAIFTQDVIIRGEKSIPLYRRVVEAGAPMAIVIPAKGSSFSMKLRSSDISWNDFLEKVKNSKEEEFVAVEKPVEAFTNILFSSGTTGDPKAIPWTNMTPLKAAADAWCHMDIHQGDIVAWPTNLGWMMGPWLVYASLLNGASIALYNGSPLGSGFAKFVQDARVTMLGVIPSIVRAWKSSNCTVVSSVEIERICNAVDDSILETAAIGVPPPKGGPERLVIAVVYKDSNVPAPDLNKLRMAFNSALQQKLNPLFRVSHIVPLSTLPRTASNKVMRRVLRQQFAQLDQSRI